MNKGFLIGRKDLAEVLRRPSAWVLIAVNLGLITGVVIWNWQIFDIVFLYWVENLVIGVVNVLKMAVANPAAGPLGGGINRLQAALENNKKKPSTPGKHTGTAIKYFLIPFFIIHYGMFCYGHGVFIFSIFGDQNFNNGGGDAAENLQLLTNSMLFAIGLLTASHLFSFFRNFLAAGEYQRIGVEGLMTRPYGRIVALHITIILGAFLTMALGNPLGLLIVLMILKTSVDLAMHQAERRKLTANPV